MKVWFLVVFLLYGDNTGKVVEQVGPFKDEAQCTEARAALLRSSMLKDAVCVEGFSA
jgi:hypothetical protein